jgi:hypothetical protein
MLWPISWCCQAAGSVRLSESKKEIGCGLLSTMLQMHVRSGSQSVVDTELINWSF